jgi:hypothetical protein
MAAASNRYAPITSSTPAVRANRYTPVESSTDTIVKPVQAVATIKDNSQLPFSYTAPTASTNQPKTSPTQGINNIPSISEQQKINSLFSNGVAKPTAQSTPVATDKSYTPLDAVDQVFRTVRASSILAAGVPAQLINKATGSTVSSKELAKETVQEAKDTLSGKKSFFALPEQAAQDYLKSKGIGKYGGKEPGVIDIITLASIGFSDLFGDPLLGASALTSLGKAGQEAALWKKVGQINKPLAEGTNIVKGIKWEIPIADNLKIKITPKSNEVVIQGFTKRFGNFGETVMNSKALEEGKNIAMQLSKQSGREIAPIIQGDNLYLRLIKSIIQNEQGFVKIPGTAAEKGVAVQSGAQAINQQPVKSIFNKPAEVTNQPTEIEHQAVVNQISNLATQNGFKGISITDKPITDYINNQPAPTGVDFVSRTIKINPTELANDIERLKTEGIKLPNGDITYDPAEYVTSLVNFEKQHLLNATVSDLNALRAATTEAEKKVILEYLDKKAVESYTKEFPPKQNNIVVPPTPVRTPPPSMFPHAETMPTTAKQSVADTADDILKSGTQSLSPDIASTIDPLEKIVGGDKRTPLTERIRWIDYLRTPWKVFDRMGIRPSFESLLKGYEDYVAELPKNIDKITAWSKRVDKVGNEKIFRSLDGEPIELTVEENQVANEIKTWLREWADRLGMSPDARISDYITHIFPLGKGGEIPEEIALIINKKIPGSVYDPFLLQRQGAEGYIKNTWSALDAYTKRATRKVNMDPALAELKEASAKLTDVSQINYLNSYLGAVNLRPTALDTSIDNHIKEKFGYLFGARPTASITLAMRKMITRAKIGGSITSFAKNLTQGVNTFSELGTFYTTKGYMDLVKFGAKELEENGVLGSSFIEDRTYSAVKKMAEKFDNVLFLNMNASELVNRGAAYYGGKAKFLKNKTTAKEFREALGREKPVNYTPTIQDAITYGKFVAGKTQFLFGPLHTPVALNSDIAKTAAQFQTFGLKQTEFIGHMLGAREWAKLIRYIMSSMLLFTFIGNAFGMDWTDTFKTLRWGYPPAVQFFKDLYDRGILGQDKYGNKINAEKRATSVGKTIFSTVVPAGAQIQKTYEGLTAVGAGKETTPAGKFKYKINQNPANYVRGTLFGKYNLPENTAFFNKQADKTSKTKTNRANRYTPL